MPRDAAKGEARANRDGAYIEDIHDSVKRLVQYTSGVAFAAFSTNEILQDAVLRRLSVIGEAAACLSPEYKSKMPAVPWKRVIGFRNLVVHRYWAVDLTIVWRIVTEEIPILIEALDKVRAQT
jgi:uncharacterized protein with HEPN domain